ncbi:MAG: HEAT repeat domain-containing protein, partial [Planctomycetes bacterium]|nr:HEAT repeat domain-containing protein [Planctomycetota bacterium]
GRTMERFVALRLLAGVDETRRVKTLYRAALSDASWRARHMAVDSLAQRDDGTTFRPFVKALLKHPEPFVQVNAAEALGQLGDRRGVAPLVRALKGTQDGRVARSNFQSINQIAYVKDYDVEVAQTAFIADPVVDVVLDGMVLDVGVIDIQRQRVIYGRALGRLTQAKVDPESIGAWMDWWRQEGKSKFGSR